MYGTWMVLHIISRMQLKEIMAVPQPEMGVMVLSLRVNTSH